MKYWVTLQVPVEADEPQTALDFGWEKLLDPEGPPEGLSEHVTVEKPPVEGCLTVGEPTTASVVNHTDEAHEHAA